MGAACGDTLDDPLGGLKDDLDTGNTHDGSKDEDTHGLESLLPLRVMVHVFCSGGPVLHGNVGGVGRVVQSSIHSTTHLPTVA